MFHPGVPLRTISALLTLVAIVRGHTVYSENVDDFERLGRSSTDDDEILRRGHDVDTVNGEAIHWTDDADEFPGDESYVDIFDYEGDEDRQRTHDVELDVYAGDEIISDDYIVDHPKLRRHDATDSNYDSDAANRVVVMQDEVADAEEDERPYEEMIRPGLHPRVYDASTFEMATRGFPVQSRRMRTPIWTRRREPRVPRKGGADTRNRYGTGERRKVLGTLRMNGDFYLDGGFLRPVEGSWFKGVDRNGAGRPSGARRFLNNANPNANSNINVNRNVNGNYNG